MSPIDQRHLIDASNADATARAILAALTRQLVLEHGDYQGTVILLAIGGHAMSAAMALLALLNDSDDPLAFPGVTEMIQTSIAKDARTWLAAMRKAEEAMQ